MDRMVLPTNITLVVLFLTGLYSFTYFNTVIDDPIVVNIFAQGPTNETMINNAPLSNSTNSTMVNDNSMNVNNSKPITGEFVGTGDGIHNAEGIARILILDDGSEFLRLENLKVTNGPDLYVYLATDKSATDYVDLGLLKGNIGNQNYQIQEGTDLTKYNNVLIWCKAFSVLFGSAELRG